ncbi:hypothetical protein GCM10009854_26180 [Saccharopolyspora halophila]|uniref:PE-PGRS family protein n=1 Tax=Saccharopolyspora halophila TaxID=405551 RepID=A0ABN3GC68_9PSEU
MGSYCIAELERAGWVRESTLRDAACLSLVRGTDLGGVAEAFGAVTTHGRPLDIDEFCEEAFAYQEKHPMIALRQIGDWVLVVEDSGDQGIRPEVLRRAGDPEAVTLYWNEYAQTRFAHTTGGVVRTTFAAALPDFREGTDPDGLEGLRAGLPWCEADPVSVMTALAGRLTGLASGPDWLSGEFVTFPVAPWPDDLVPVALDDVEGYPAELLRAVHSSAEHDRRSLVRMLARHVAAAGDCLDLPVVQRLVTGVKPACGEVDQTVRELVWHGIWKAPASSDRNRVRAIQVLRHAMHADSRVAVTGILAEAPRVRGVRAPEITELVRGELLA